MADTNLDKLKRVLNEIFMLDQADLDFGIYRIMNVKRDELTRFITDELLPQVRTELGVVDDGQRAQTKAELDEAIGQAKALGVEADGVQKVLDLRTKYNATTDIAALENEVFSHLASFFRRYYKEGDFLSLRRYKEGVYAIPYEGEEVKLHWANADQYYIKSSEQFRDYVFKLTDERRVHFKLAEASTETDNNKPAAGKDRRFVLCADDAVTEQDGELIIRFEYRADPDGRKRETLNAEAEPKVLSAAPQTWRAALAANMPTEKHPDRTLLAKYLNDYTATNAFDYFIHKNLGGFLRRELDFYIKNEVMRLDDIEKETAPKVEQYLAKVRAIRRIAHKTIDMLAQLEDFQKKLWLKKKFVVETNYCVTLDRVPEELYAEIAANDAQREEWVRLFAIDQIKGDMTTPAYSTPLSTEFLKACPTLLVDTKHFDPDFSAKLTREIDDLEGNLDDLLINAENFQALSLVQSRYREQVKFVYIDPPYNTDASPIVYKNGYRRSSWASLLSDRMSLDAMLRVKPSVRCVAIDDFEYPDLQGLLESLSSDVHHATAAVRSKPQGRPTASGFSANHEYAVFWGDPDAKIGRLPRSGSKAERYPHADEKGTFAWSNFRKSGTDSDRSDRPRSFYPVYVSGDSVRVPDLVWENMDDGWKVLEDLTQAEEAVWPIDPDKIEKVWTCSPERARSEIADIRVQRDEGGRIELQKKYRPHQTGSLPGTWWADSTYSASESGTKVLKDMFGAKTFDYPKSVHLVADCIRVGAVMGSEIVLDYFAGSGTTGHALMNLNREDGGDRRYILIEMGQYFDTVLKPRIQKAIYSKDWKDGRPVSRQGSSHMFKYIRLESYEDAVANLKLKRTESQQALLESESGLREDYLLRYMLDVEADGGASLLNITAFEDPFHYQLDVANGSAGETQRVNVDLVETFNYLIGLRVKTIDRIQGFRVVTGESPAGEKVLIIWRKVKENPNAALDEFFRKQGYTTKDREFDIIYVNGDNNLENLRRDDETWKVRLIDEDFKRLMFDVRDV